MIRSYAKRCAALGLVDTAAWYGPDARRAVATFLKNDVHVALQRLL